MLHYSMGAFAGPYCPYAYSPTPIRYLTVLCKDGSKLRYCAPNKNKDAICNDPNNSWSKAKCATKGGLDHVVRHLTGCFPCYGNCDALCNAAPYDMSDEALDLVNGGFEDAVLTPWVWRPSVRGQTAPQVINDGTAPEGSYYLRITSYCPSPNKVTRRDIIVGTDGGCGTGVMLSFYYKFKAGDYLPFNDCMNVNAKVNGITIKSVNVCVSDVGNYGQTQWVPTSVDLGKLKAGSFIVLAISGSVQDARDCALNSSLMLDGFKITYY